MSTLSSAQVRALDPYAFLAGRDAAGGVAAQLAESC